MNAAEAFFDSRERNVFVATTPAAQVLEALEQGLEHALPIVLLTGDAGVGKTATLREAAARWASRVQAAWLDGSRTSTSAIFADTIRAFGGHVRGKDKRAEQVGRLTHALGAIRQKGLIPLLIVDSAQVLENEALTELGRIESASSAAGFELKMIIAGRPEIVDRLASDQHEPLEVHVGVRAVHGKMSFADTREYLTHVLGGQTTEGDEVFPKKSAREIHDGTNGVPGLVNALADEAVRCAHATGSAQVGPEHVRAVLAAAFPSDGTAAAADGSASAAATPGAPGAAGQAPVDAHQAPAGKPDAKAGIPEKPKRIAAHKPPATPEGAAARVPPPPARRRSLPTPPISDLDSSHPRVRDWVSRFTAGQPPVRFGGRGSLPAGDPSEGLPAESPEATSPSRAGAPEAGRPVWHGAAPDPAAEAAPAKSEHPRNRRLERVRDAEAARKLHPPAPPAPRAAAAPAETSVQAKSAAAPPRAGGQPAPADLTHIARLDPAPLEVPQASSPAPVPLEVTPEQLTPPPLVLDESPAAAVPEPGRASAPTPAAPAEPPRISPPPAAPAPPRLDSRPAPAPTPAARPASPAPPMEQPGLAHATSRPSSPPPGASTPLSRKQQKAAARRAERVARRMAEAQARQAARPAQAATPAPTPAPASKSATQTPVPAASGARPAAPVVLTLDAVKPVSVAPAATAKAGATRAGNAPAQATTTVSHLRPARSNDLPSGDVSPPRLDRVLAVLIPALLILGMAIAAFILGRRGAFDRQADAGSDRVDPVTASMPAVPAPTAAADSAALAEPKPDSIADSQPFEPPIPEPVVEPDPIPEPGPARFCLAVGTYLFEERAREKARTLSGRTGQKAWVEPTRTGGGRSYRILFGAYASEGAAERDADRLLSRGFVTEAMVENLPAKRRGR